MKKHDCAHGGSYFTLPTGKMHGVEISFHESALGDVRVSRWNNGRKHGIEKFWFKDKNSASLAGIIHWKYGKKAWSYVGNGEVPMKKVPRLKRRWCDGKKCRNEKKWSKNGILVFKRSWREDLKNGMETKWYLDGQMKWQVLYVNGKKAWHGKEMVLQRSKNV